MCERQMTDRDNCIICNCKDIKEVYRFKEFPIYMGVSTGTYNEDIRQDMSFGECDQCGCIQLKKLIPLDILYAKGHNPAIGSTWDRHHREFYEFVRKYATGKIVEIGGGNLKLALHLQQEKAIDSIVVYDNNSYHGETPSKISFKQGFFDSIGNYEKVDCIIHSHLIEHLYDPMRDIATMTQMLSIDGYMFIAAPLIDNMLKDKFTNAMNFEHTYMLTYSMLQHVLANAGLEIIDKRDFSKHVSFVVAKKVKTPIEAIGDYKKCGKIFKEFVSHYLSEIEQIKKKLIQDKSRTFIFGAHIFTQYLFSFGLEEENFKNILDNDPAKQNNRLYGSRLMVKSPKILKDIENPIVVLKAAQYTNEIKKDILENINPNTRFIL